MNIGEGELGVVIALGEEYGEDVGHGVAGDGALCVAVLSWDVHTCEEGEELWDASREGWKHVGLLELGRLLSGSLGK